MLASGTALAHEGAMVVAARRHPLITKMAEHNQNKVTSKMVEDAARQGDAIACRIMAREAMLIGVGMVNCVHAFDPELVVLSGGVMKASDLLLEPLRATVAERVMPAFEGSCDIVLAALAGESGAPGAVAAAIDHLH